MYTYVCELSVKHMWLVLYRNLSIKVKKYKKTSRATSALDTSVVLESVLI